jgi:hypothetical protein
VCDYSRAGGIANGSLSIADRAYAGASWAEADYGGSAGASPYQDDGIMAARREPWPTKNLALPDQIQIAEFVPEIALLDRFIIRPVNHAGYHERCQQIEMARFRFM